MQELPKDFIALIREHYGNQDAEALCEALLATEPEVSVRLNRRKISAWLHSPSLTGRVGGGLTNRRNLSSVETYRHFRFCSQQGIAQSISISLAVVLPHKGYEILGQLLHWK